MALVLLNTAIFIVFAIGMIFATMSFIFYELRKRKLSDKVRIVAIGLFITCGILSLASMFI